VIVDVSEPLIVTGARPVFEFQTTGSDTWPTWDRFIALRGGLKFHIGNICNTCDFFFQRLSDAFPDTRPGAGVATTLNAGVADLRGAPVGDISPMLPDGAYRVALSRGVPQLVHPGAPSDFFASEQVELWKADPTILRDGLHDPATPYYRFGMRNLGEGRALYEIIIPTIPIDRVDADTVQRYLDRFDEAGTALAVSVLDVKGPALFDDTPQLDITEHWVLAHYLLDGNHKIYAASRGEREITVLSFVTLEHGVSTAQDVSEALATIPR
jgi:hypothetical protein